MKTMHSLFLLILIIALGSCGRKNNKKEQVSLETNQDLQWAQAQPRAEMTMEQMNVQASEEIIYALQKSGLSMKKIKKGSPIFIQCSSFAALEKMNLCRVGFDNRDIDLGNHIIHTIKSQEIYELIYDHSLKQRMMNGRLLTIKCQENYCEIQPILKKKVEPKNQTDTIIF